MKRLTARITYALAILALCLAMIACSWGGQPCDSNCALGTEGARAWHAQQTAMAQP